MEKNENPKARSRWMPLPKATGALIGLWAALTGAVSGGALAPVTVAAAPPQPSVTISRYMETVDARTPANSGVAGVLYTEGCNMGSAAVTGLLELHFGGAGWIGTSTYGAYNWNGHFYTTAQIQAAGEAFLYGYWNCSPSYPFVTLALAASNSGNGDSYGHGQAWSNMVNAVDSWIIAMGYQSQEYAYGGMDFEQSFGTAAQARSWVSGYQSQRNLAFFNDGSADSCPASGQTNGTNHACGSTGWSQDDYYYLNWWAPTAWALPEIYRTDGTQANQWEQIALYGYYHYNSSLGFSGELTQQGACQTNGCDPSVDNAPSAGWTQLWNATGSSSHTSNQQYFKYSSDITWAN